MKLWGFSTEAVEVVMLPLSELTANAAAAARLPTRPDLLVWIRPSLDLRAVLVTIWDGSPHVPVLRVEVDRVMWAWRNPRDLAPACATTVGRSR